VSGLPARKSREAPFPRCYSSSPASAPFAELAAASATACL
jgi:hypothetical protein